MPELSNFGERLKSIIKKSGYSQKKLCELWEISDESLSRYFKGNTNPKSDLLEKISKSLNVSIFCVNKIRSTILAII